MFDETCQAALGHGVDLVIGNTFFLCPMMVNAVAGGVFTRDQVESIGSQIGLDCPGYGF